MADATGDAGRARHTVTMPGAAGTRRRAIYSARAAGIEEELAALRRAQRISRTGSWEFDYATEQVTVSDELLELIGVDRTALAFGGRVLLQAVLPEDRDAVDQAMRELVADGASINIRYRSTRSEGSPPAWFSARGEAERDGRGELVRVSCVVADISELVRAEEELRAAHAELLQAHGFQQAVLATTPDAIHVLDLVTGTYERANRTGTALIGYTPTSIEVLSGTGLDDVVPLEDRAAYAATLAEARSLVDGEVVQVRHRVLEPDGSVTWLSRRCSVFARNADGTACQLLVVSRDVSDLVEVEQLLEHAATHDELTGLPNRRFVQGRLDAFLRGGGTGAAAVLVIDLDRFKRINDGYGRAVGDAVLGEVAARLVAATRGHDTVARLGGDEFVVVLWTDDRATAAALADSVAVRIQAAIAEPLVFGGRECSLTASIGSSVVSPGAGLESALAEADAAMYAVKNHGANGYTMFDASIAADVRRDDLVERSLRHALRAGTVEVHYQPVVAPGTGIVHAVEALVRIGDDRGGWYDAGLVIEVAERVGLVSELDDCVLRLACEQVARWRAEPLYADLRLSLNRSAQDILRPGFHDRIMDALQSTALPATALTIEITETVLLDAAEEAVTDIRRLYTRGIRLAIDDFGTGYASLSQLTRLPISTIKIDRSFTSNMLHDRTCRALVRATVGIASDLRMDCVVEGVETEEDLVALPRYEHLLIQGYLYGRPRPARDGLGVNVARW